MHNDAPRRPARERTRATLLALIRDSSGLTRSDLNQLTGLSPSTIGHAVAGLIADEEILERGHARTGRGTGSGRPGALLHPVRRPARLAAIVFGLRYVTVGVSDETGAILDRVRIDISADADPAAIDVACDALDTLTLKTGIPPEQAVAGIPRPLDRSGRVHATAPWLAAHPGTRLTERLGIPVHAANVAHLAAIGELRRGGARDARDFLYVFVGHGVGGGLVLQGRLYRGSDGLAGDIGHDKLPGGTALCRCGERGCLEASVSYDSLREMLARTHPHADRDTLMMADDPITARILFDAGRDLGSVVARLCNLLDLPLLVVGGMPEMIRPDLLRGLRWALTEYGRPERAARTQVVASPLGLEAALVGAAQLAAERAVQTA